MSLVVYPARIGWQAPLGGVIHFSVLEELLGAPTVELTTDIFTTLQHSLVRAFTASAHHAHDNEALYEIYPRFFDIKVRLTPSGIDC